MIRDLTTLLLFSLLTSLWSQDCVEGEPFIDINENGIYDEGEPFTDLANGFWYPWQDFIDSQNGIWDPWEEYEDGNDIYDEDEYFVDSNNLVYSYNIENPEFLGIKNSAGMIVMCK